MTGRASDGIAEYEVTTVTSEKSAASLFGHVPQHMQRGAGMTAGAKPVVRGWRLFGVAKGDVVATTAEPTLDLCDEFELNGIALVRNVRHRVQAPRRYTTIVDQGVKETNEKRRVAAAAELREYDVFNVRPPGHGCAHVLT